MEKKFIVAIDDLDSNEHQRQYPFLKVRLIDDTKYKDLVVDITLKEVQQNLQQSCSSVGEHDSKEHFLFFRWGVVNYGYVDYVVPSLKILVLDGEKAIKIPDNRMPEVLSTISRY